VILDSDDEEEGQVKRELSPSVSRSMTASFASIGSMPPRSQTGESDVIDLTLDSEEENPAPPQKKRKVTDQEVLSPTEQIWKKSRPDHHPLPPRPTSSTSAGSYGNRAVYSPSRDPRVPPSPSSHYLPRGASAYSPASYIPPGGAPIPPRSAIPRADSYPTPPARMNGANTSHWSSQRY
jgi:E3 SUMO-protein ligase PIAS1